MSQPNKTSEQAKEFIKKNKQLLIDKFTKGKALAGNQNAVAIFMAGSPGAGKTEYSKRLVAKFNGDIVRIDADDIRTVIPEYTGNNSDLVQGAASIGVDILYSHVLKHGYNLLLDATFANFDISKSNIERALQKNREVVICYVYQDPIIAWEFTQKREKLEGRKVPRKVFIDSFVNARKNVIKIKSLYKEKIKVFLIVKDYANSVKESYFDVYIDSYLQTNYTKQELEKMLR